MLNRRNLMLTGMAGIALPAVARAEDRDVIKSMFPKARFAKIPGAGHWLHAEKPKEFIAMAETYLD